MIFDLYLELGSDPALKSELDKRRIITKRRITRKKKQSGGILFSRGHPYKLLCNPIYIGKVRHKDKVYEGEHDPIIDLEVWSAVQAKLKDNAPKRTRNINLKSSSLLTGLIYDETGDRLSPVHTQTRGRRYHYYISRRLTLGEMDDGSGWRLPAQRIERHVISKLTALLDDPAMLIDALDLKELTQNDLKSVMNRAGSIVADINSANPQMQRERLISFTHRIEMHPDKLVILVNRQALFPEPVNTVELIPLQYNLIQKRRGVETRLIIGGIPLGVPDPKLISVIASAKDWQIKLESGLYKSLNEIAATEQMDNADVSRTLPLAFIAPSIVRDILNGHQPVDLTADKLRRKSSRLPLCWKAQRIYLGFGS